MAFSQPIEFEVYLIKNVGHISIPSNMEIQSGNYKKVSETFQNEFRRKYSYEVIDNRVVFQQKGLNKFSDPGFGTYARVIIETEIGVPGDFNKLSNNLNLSSAEISKLNTDFKKQFKQELSSVGIKLLEWYGVREVVINNWAALEISYLRQLNNNQPVKVILFFIPNYDRMHYLTTSYRQSDQKTWQPILEKIVSSFTITNIR